MSSTLIVFAIVLASFPVSASIDPLYVKGDFSVDARKPLEEQRQDLENFFRTHYEEPFRQTVENLRLYALDHVSSTREKLFHLDQMKFENIHPEMPAGVQHLIEEQWIPSGLCCEELQLKIHQVAVLSEYGLRHTMILRNKTSREQATLLTEQLEPTNFGSILYKTRAAEMSYYSHIHYHGFPWSPTVQELVNQTSNGILNSTYMGLWFQKRGLSVKSLEFPNYKRLFQMEPYVHQVCFRKTIPESTRFIDQHYGTSTSAFSDYEKWLVRTEYLGYREEKAKQPVEWTSVDDRAFPEFAHASIRPEVLFEC